MHLNVEVATRIESASAMRAVDYAQTAARLFPELKAQAVPVGGGYLVYGGVGSPVCRVVGLGLGEPLHAATFDQIERAFAVLNERSRIAVSPIASPALIELLQRRGYRPHSELAAFALPLPAALDAPIQVATERVGLGHEGEWVELSVQGFANGAVPERGARSIAAPNAFSELGACYIARLGATAIASGAAYRHANTVEFGATSVLPAYRRHGAHRALVARRANDAALLGCDLAFAMAEPESGSAQSLIRLGFQFSHYRTTWQLGA